MKTVGFIGLGTMGLPMAMNLIEAGYELVSMVHENPEPGEQIKRRGGVLVGSPARVVSQSDVTVLILPSDVEVREVFDGPDGLITGEIHGKCVIEMTTATPSTVIDVAQQLDHFGASLLDAPVSGGRTGAENGTLTIMVGGNGDVLAAQRDVLETLGSNIYHVGDIGAGKATKLINQLLNATHMIAFAEALALATKANLFTDVLVDVLRQSSGYSKVMDLKYERFIKTQRFDPAFKLSLMDKDIRLGLEMADLLGVPLFLANQARQFYKGALARGDKDLDYSVVSSFIADIIPK